MSLAELGIGSVYTEPRRCLPCGKMFVPPRRRVDSTHGVVDYCSDECRHNAQRRSGQNVFQKEEGRLRFRAPPNRDPGPTRPKVTKPLTRSPENLFPRKPRDYAAQKIKNIGKAQPAPGAPPWATRMMRLRLAQNLSREELAEPVGCAKNTIEKWERGKVEPSISNFAKIAGALGVSLDELWTGNKYGEDRYEPRPERIQG